MINFPFDVTKEKSKKKRKKPIKLVSSETFIDKDNGRVILTLPIETVSEGNCFEPWQQRHKRHKLQKKKVWIALLPIKYLIHIPCTITLCRISPGTLDAHDNLPMSLKYICDAVASELTGDYRPGQADNNKDLTWKYSQEKSSAYGIKIELVWIPEKNESPNVYLDDLVKQAQDLKMGY